MSGYPIRIAIRVDFSDGSQHEYEVRGQDAAEPLPGFFPEGVVTANVAKRMEYDQKRQDEIRQLRQELDEARRFIDSLRAIAGTQAEAGD